MTTRKLLRRIGQALARLTPINGRVARRNARRDLFASMRALRARVDALYPPIPGAAVARRRGRRAYAIVPSGLVVCTAGACIARVAQAGIGVRYIGGSPMVPQWARDIAMAAPAKLRAARRSIKLRHALVTEIALRRGAP